MPSFGHVREDAEIDSPGGAPTTYRHDMSSDCGLFTRFEGIPYSKSSNNVLRKSSNRSMMARDENDAPGTHGRSTISMKLRAFPSISSLRSLPSIPHMKIQSSPHVVQPEGSSKIPRMRSLNTVSCLASPRDEVLLKRRSRSRLPGPASSVKSSPGLTAAVERQFGIAVTGSPAQRFGCGVERPSPSSRLVRDGTVESGLEAMPSRSNMDAQAMGSKRMVDMFLNSRLRRTQGSKSDMGSSPAFL